jgi:DNA-binding transcriptional MerR regulator
MVGEDGSVTIESAAALMNVEVRAIRQWSAIGSLQIERRGDEELVHLGQVKALARSRVALGDRKEIQRSGIRGLLRGASAVDPQSVASLQALARERGTTDN